MSEPRLMVGLGEVLWDILPSGKVLGGAPSNFAFMATALGNRGILASRVGNDELGNGIRRAMLDLDMSTEFLQADDIHKTGTAGVFLDRTGQPEFTIAEPVAWDFLEWTPGWEKLASQVDVVCYGSLAQRSITSASTIENFLKATPLKALRICDANLRKPFPIAATLRKSFQFADVLKLNEQELFYACSLLEVHAPNELELARKLLREFNLKLICITRGASGSMLVTASELELHPGLSVTVVDSIGAGDAFTACVAHGLREGRTLKEISEVANRIASWVATQVGAIQSLPPSKLQELIEGSVV